MTELIVRKLRFAFADHHVPFLWNESNPAFSSMANAVSFLAIAFEKMIGQMIPEAMPLITDPVIAEEADAFVRQEGQHSMGHRQHAKGLIKSYPGLKETLDEVIAAFDDLTANKPLKYRLAYTADLEATFTPVFKLMLDHDDTLFAPGDDRVASLFLWHFVEEVEHRSSALIIYDAVANDPWYRMRMAPSIFRHVWSVLRIACEGFNKHVPLEDRKIDALSMFGMQARKSRCSNISHSWMRRMTVLSRTRSDTYRRAKSWWRCRERCAVRFQAITQRTRSCRHWPTNGSPGTRPDTRSRSGTPPARRRERESDDV